MRWIETADGKTTFRGPVLLVILPLTFVGVALLFLASLIVDALLLIGRAVGAVAMLGKRMGRRA